VVTEQEEQDELPTNTVICDDAFDVLDSLPSNSVHAVITDPPYGLSFMGKSWDDFEPREYQEWCRRWAAKALRVLKPGGHLLAFSGNRTHHRLFTGVEDAGFEVRDTVTWHYGSGFPRSLNLDQSGWEGWGTSLKPSTEFVVLARNPLSEDTIAENVMEHGTGAINIDACRIGDGVDQGRHPANLVLDETAAEQLDEQSGELSSSPTGFDAAYSIDGSHDGYQSDAHEDYVVMESMQYDDEGGASRFFYTSKASRSERTMDGRIDNPHPTVKPVDLMEWLVQLTTAEEQIVLDPFCGSGTTLVAAKNVGRKFVGIELNPEYADVARVRAGLKAADAELVTDGGQRTLGEEYDD